MGQRGITKSPDASSVSFDNENNDFDAETVQEALEEVGASASPGFNFGRSGNLSTNTWLFITGSVSSNRTGITVALTDPEIAQVYVANENISTFDVGIYEHEGDETNLTLLTTVSLVSTRSDNFNVSVAVTSGRQLAARITSGSGKNVNVGLQLKGKSS